MVRHTGHPHEATSPYLDWRRRCLSDAGFDPSVAEWLAGDEEWDLHELLKLVGDGCPPELALRILAPLDPDPVGRP